MWHNAFIVMGAVFLVVGGLLVLLITAAYIRMGKLCQSKCIVIFPQILQTYEIFATECNPQC